MKKPVEILLDRSYYFTGYYITGNFSLYVIDFHLCISDSLINTLSGHKGSVTSVSFDREGLLASGSNDTTIKLWNTKTGECLRTLTGHGSFVNSVSFDAEGLLASGSADSTIKLWNTTTGECLRTLTGHGGSVLSVSFDREGRLASGSWGEIKLWNRY